MDKAVCRAYLFTSYPRQFNSFPQETLHLWNSLPIQTLPLPMRNWCWWTKLDLHKLIHLTHPTLQFFIKIYVILESNLILFLCMNLIPSYHRSTTYKLFFSEPCIYHMKGTSQASFPKFPMRIKKLVTHIM